ncbi:MAG TPA: AI-2E family transporter [Thermomicrobiales bacterium]|nr:AI-2E family transporter [Thermomicrobiales bacterium]
MDGLGKFTSGIRSRFSTLKERGAAPARPLAPPTPIYISSRVRLIILLLIGIGLYIIARDAPTVVSLLLIGSTVALILSFPVRLLSRVVPRGLAITIVALSTAVFAILLLAVIVPFAITEISRFAETFPTTIEKLQNLTRDVLFQFYERGWIHQHPDMVLEDIESGLFDAGQRIVTDALTNTVDWLTRSVSLLITTFGVIFVAIYLLIDIPRFKDSFIRMWAPAYREDAQVLWDTIGNSLSRYLGGLLISIIIQGLAAFIGLTIIGVPYAVLLGVWMAVTAILPYIGAFMGAIPPVIIALTISWKLAVATVILYIIINQIEANFITPPIQGSAVRVHPLMIFFSVFAGSAMFGVIGAVMAVPALAVLRVLGEFFWLRLQVREDQPTLLSAMRADSVPERIARQTPIAGIMEAEAAEDHAEGNEPPGM